MRVLGTALPNSFGWDDEHRERDFVQNFNRQALHAYNLELIHPKTKKAVSYDAELPDDIKNLITMLNIND